MQKSISFEKQLFWGALILYAAAWATHLYTGTVALRGFFGDGALAFLIHLSESYVFNKPGSTIHLFSVPLPRDAQLLLNALGLQGALWLGIRNPMTLKYIFVFWQYALPGFLYLILFAFLWRNGKLHWAIFPLISWAILSAPVDVLPVNSTRWAMPIFWMHFFLVLSAGPKVRLWPLTGVLLTGVAMWGGLYEIVVLYCGLCVGFGLWLWVREKNMVPFAYALAAAPGACRALLSYINIGHSAPNNFYGFALLPSLFVLLPSFLGRVATWVDEIFGAFFSVATFGHPVSGSFHAFPDDVAGWYFYLLLIGVPIAYIIAIAVAPKVFLPYLKVVLIALAVFAIGSGAGPLHIIPVQLRTRFDYVFLSLGLMAWAGGVRVWGLSPSGFAVPAAIVALLAGAALWAVQAEQTFGWQTCHADYEVHSGDRPLIANSQIYALIRHDDRINGIDEKSYDRCEWGDFTPWTDLLLTPDTQIRQFSLSSFWEDFSFVKKNGEIYLHTNQWTLLAPSVQPGEADLPLKTLLYDLTPLYKQLGLGPFFKRVRCMDAPADDSFLRRYFESLDNDQRALMHICPR